MKLSQIYRRLLAEENPDDEHWDELAQTGFWGKQGAGVLLLAKDTKRILLQLRSADVQEPHTWGVTGGAMDRGETPVQACKREVREELEYDGSIDLIPLYVFHDAKSGFKYHNFLGIVDSEFDPSTGWEVDEYGWFDFGDFPSPLHFGVNGILSDASSVNKIKKAIASAGKS